MTLACQHDAGIEILHILNRETLAQGNRNGHLAGSAVHGVDIGYVDHGTLVTQVFQGHVGEVKMNALHEHVGCNQDLLVLTGVIQYGAVVTNSVKGGCVLWLKVFCQVVYKTELSEFCYFGTFDICHCYDVISCLRMIPRAQALPSQNSGRRGGNVLLRAGCKSFFANRRPD